MHLQTLLGLTWALSAQAFTYPDFVPLHRRQDPGTPEYDCHANCGGVIVTARKENYCDTDTFKTELSDCLSCALEYDIWKYYGTSVTKAAKECGVDATPSPAESSSTSTSESTSTSVPSVSSTGDAVVSMTLSPSPVASGTQSASASVSVPVTVSGSNTGTSSAVPSSTAVNSNSTATSTGVASPTVSLFPGMAAGVERSELLMGVLGGVAVAAFL
ncbi:hypothetical protein BDV25DRAFT_136832 [Aspergillus avenaceus]|uniref:Uncharacterized protein n=1 Tax=Aspergillus avenaceus TaxID=36643 RepID=A0A5N6U544_ASPAV|nr:hypothetical protein BDV25DRAFT_136832 [Aspergillus avenaceus]